MANWVSAGCGVIANELAQAMEKRGQKLYGVVNRTPEKAVAFAEKYGVQKVFTSFQDVWKEDGKLGKCRLRCHCK
jgi:predicted dehydrogenase